MARSQAGIAEVQILSKGALDEYIVGSSLPAGAARIQGGIAANKELSSEPYDPPKDLYNSVIHQNGKRNFKVLVDTLQADWRALDAIRYIHAVDGGADVLFIPEGFSEYEGNASGVPTVGGGTYWLYNPTGGIWFFDYPNRTHMGVEWEYKLTDKSQSILITLEAAVSALKAKQLALAAQTNIVKKSAVIIPDVISDYSNVLELKEVQRHNGTSWVSVFSYDDINSLDLNIKTVSGRQTKDNRTVAHIGELSLTVVGTDASCAKMHELWSIDQFSRIRLILTNPQNGLDYYFEVSKNRITNVSDPYINKDRRDNTFKVMGQFPIAALYWDVWTTRTIRIGSSL